MSRLHEGALGLPRPDPDFGQKWHGGGALLCARLPEREAIPRLLDKVSGAQKFHKFDREPGSTEWLKGLTRTEIQERSTQKAKEKFPPSPHQCVMMIDPMLVSFT